MGIITKLTDVDNTFLGRREITCKFTGLAGKIKKLEAVDMISKEYGLNGKYVIPVSLKNHLGKPLTTGIFYVYDDESVAKKQADPAIIARLEKARAKQAEAAPKEEKSE